MTQRESPAAAIEAGLWATETEPSTKARAAGSMRLTAAGWLGFDGGFGSVMPTLKTQIPAEDAASSAARGAASVVTVFPVAGSIPMTVESSGFAGFVLEIVQSSPPPATTAPVVPLR